MDMDTFKGIKIEPGYTNESFTNGLSMETPMVVVHQNYDTICQEYDPNLRIKTEDNIDNFTIKNEPELNLIDDPRLVENNDTIIDAVNDVKSQHYACGLCEESFANYNDLEKHVNSHENSHPLSKREQNLMNGKCFPCSLCTRIFAWPSHLKYHMDTHTGKKRHTCPMCFKSFTRSSHLNSHMLLHTGEKPHTCTECKKSFSRQSHLKSHMLLHTGEKRNVCPVCAKSFTQACSLKSHLLIHSGERPYTCDLCSKSFTQYSNLKAHLLTHSGIKQQTQRQKKMTTIAADDEGGRLLVQQQNLPPPPTVAKQIIAIMSNKTRSQCSLCKKSFAKQRTLSAHLVKAHKKSEIELNYCAKCMETFSDVNAYYLHVEQMHGGLQHQVNIKMEPSDDNSEDESLQDDDGSMVIEPEVTIKEEELEE